MPNCNLVVLMGNLTRDFEMRYTPKGVAIAGSSLAINRKWKSENGTEQEEVCFVEITAFDRGAEALSQYTKKGDPLFVTGRLKLDMWDDKQTGQKRTKLHVIVESFQFMGSRDAQRPASAASGTTGQRPAGQTTQPSTRTAPASHEQPELPDGQSAGNDDEVPF